MRKLLALLIVAVLLLSSAYADIADDIIASASQDEKAIIAAKLSIIKILSKDTSSYRLSYYDDNLNKKEYQLTPQEFEKLCDWVDEKADPADPFIQSVEKEIKKRIESEDFWKVEFGSVSVVKEELKPYSAKTIEVYLTWDVNNSEKQTKTMLQMYSDDLAVNIYKHIENEKIENIWCFWTIPEMYGEKKIGARYKYEQRKDGVYRIGEFGHLYGTK